MIDEQHGGIEYLHEERDDTHRGDQQQDGHDFIDKRVHGWLRHGGDGGAAVGTRTALPFGVARGVVRFVGAKRLIGQAATPEAARRARAMCCRGHALLLHCRCRQPPRRDDGTSNGGRWYLPRKTKISNTLNKASRKKARLLETQPSQHNTQSLTDRTIVQQKILSSCPEGGTGVFTLPPVAWGVQCRQTAPAS